LSPTSNQPFFISAAGYEVQLWTKYFIDDAKYSWRFLCVSHSLSHSQLLSSRPSRGDSSQRNDQEPLRQRPPSALSLWTCDLQLLIIRLPWEWMAVIDHCKGRALLEQQAMILQSLGETEGGRPGRKPMNGWETTLVTLTPTRNNLVT
jgi:hypothetical protein